MGESESPRHARLPGLAALLGRVAPCGACVVRVRRACLALSVRQELVDRPAETGLPVSFYLNTAVQYVPTSTPSASKSSTLAVTTGSSCRSAVLTSRSWSLAARARSSPARLAAASRGTTTGLHRQEVLDASTFRLRVGVLDAEVQFRDRNEDDSLCPLVNLDPFIEGGPVPVLQVEQERRVEYHSPDSSNRSRISAARLAARFAHRSLIRRPPSGRPPVRARARAHAR